MHAARGHRRWGGATDATKIFPAKTRFPPIKTSKTRGGQSSTARPPAGGARVKAAPQSTLIPTVRQRTILYHHALLLWAQFIGRLVSLQMGKLARQTTLCGGQDRPLNRHSTEGCRWDPFAKAAPTAARRRPRYWSTRLVRRCRKAPVRILSTERSPSLWYRDTI